MSSSAPSTASGGLVDTVIPPGAIRTLRWYWTLFLLGNVLSCLPIWLVEYPPLVDYPNHLARDYILYHYDDFEVFQQRYTLPHEILPNLAIDTVVVPLQAIMPIEVAGKIFITLVVLLFQWGCHWLGTAIHGRPTWFALSSLFFAYHSMWLYGFVNYCFGLGMFAATLAAWLRWRAHCRILPGLLVAGLTVLCYLSHLSAFFFLFGSGAAVVFADAVQQRRVKWRQAAAMLPLLLPLLFFLGGGGGGGSVVVWNTLIGKMIGSLCMVLSYRPIFDVVVIAVLVGIAACLGFFGRNWHAHPGILLASLGLFALFLVSPYEILTGSPADARFIPPALVLLVLAIRLRLKPRLATGILAVFVMLTVSRLGLFLWDFSEASGQIAEQVAVLDLLPEGARVYPAVLLPEETAFDKKTRCYFHVVHYATIRREAYSPFLLALPRQQPVRFAAKPVTAHYSKNGPSWDESFWRPVLDNYDYIWSFACPAEAVRYLETHLKKVGEGGGGVLFRVRKAGE